MRIIKLAFAFQAMHTESIDLLIEFWTRLKTYCIYFYIYKTTFTAFSDKSAHTHIHSIHAHVRKRKRATYELDVCTVEPQFFGAHGRTNVLDNRNDVR